MSEQQEQEHPTFAGKTLPNNVVVNNDVVQISEEEEEEVGENENIDDGENQMESNTTTNDDILDPNLLAILSRMEKGFVKDPTNYIKWKQALNVQLKNLEKNVLKTVFAGYEDAAKGSKRVTFKSESKVYKAKVTKVTPTQVHFTTLDANEHTQEPCLVQVLGTHLCPQPTTGEANVAKICSIFSDALAKEPKQTTTTTGGEKKRRLK